MLERRDYTLSVGNWLSNLIFRYLHVINYMTKLNRLEAI